MVVLIVLILITYIFMAIVSFRRRFSMRSGGNVGALIVTSHSSQGLDPEAIDKLPIAVFYRSENVSVGAIDSKGLDSIKGDPSQASKDENNAGPVVHHSREWKCLSECAICLSDFKEQECIRMLPKCQHCFHKECIQSWLGSHSTCPLCRSNLLSLPKAVSLSSDTTSSSHGS
ncbi:hypothetical protein KP509_29G079200 [Ceratopteris richardii]|nr:hypothetical protein KP509_29G079200 [Ceratopteris richardii]